jgi:hypothetical protein
MTQIWPLVFVLAIILAVITVVVLIGRFISRRLTRNAPKSRFLSKIGPEQALHAAFLVSLLALIPLLRALVPATSIGRFLSSPFGVIIALVCAVLLATAFGGGVTLLGRRLRKKQRGGV